MSAPASDLPDPPDAATVSDSPAGALALSPWQLMLRRFLRHRLAVASLLLLVILYLLAIFAEFTAPYTVFLGNADFPGLISEFRATRPESFRPLVDNLRPVEEEEFLKLERFSRLWSEAVFNLNFQPNIPVKTNIELLLQAQELDPGSAKVRNLLAEIRKMPKDRR